MTNKEKINSNKHLIGKAIDSLDQCRFKRGCLLYALRGTLNTMYNTELIAKDTDYKAKDYPK